MSEMIHEAIDHSAHILSRVLLCEKFLHLGGHIVRPNSLFSHTASQSNGVPVRVPSATGILSVSPFVISQIARASHFMLAKSGN